MPAPTKVICVLVLTVIIGATAACKEKAPKTPPGLGPKVASNACARLTKRDLEAIRETVIHFCKADPRLFYWSDYVDELRQGTFYLPGQAGSPFPETALIGLWKCEVRDGHFVMAEIWHPPGRTFFGVHLAKESGRWTVRDDFGGGEIFRFN